MPLVARYFSRQTKLLFFILFFCFNTQHPFRHSHLSASSLIFSPSLKPVVWRLEQGRQLWWFISFSPWVFSLCISHASVRLRSLQTSGGLITWVFTVILPFYVMHNLYLEKNFSSDTMHSSRLQINFVHSRNEIQKYITQFLATFIFHTKTTNPTFTKLLKKKKKFEISNPHLTIKTQMQR